MQGCGEKGCLHKEGLWGCYQGPLKSTPLIVGHYLAVAPITSVPLGALEPPACRPSAQLPRHLPSSTPPTSPSSFFTLEVTDPWESPQTHNCYKLPDPYISQHS